MRWLKRFSQAGVPLHEVVRVDVVPLLTLDVTRLPLVTTVALGAPVATVEGVKTPLELPFGQAAAAAAKR
jgi:hypothetical protein